MERNPNSRKLLFLFLVASFLFSVKSVAAIPDKPVFTSQLKISCDHSPPVRIVTMCVNVDAINFVSAPEVMPIIERGVSEPILELRKAKIYVFMYNAKSGGNDLEIGNHYWIYNDNQQLLNAINIRPGLMIIVPYNSHNRAREKI